MKTNLIITLILTLTSFNLAGQDLDEVFDDGGLSEVKHNVHFSISDFSEGYLNIGYARYFGDQMFVGITLGYHAFDGYGLYMFGGDAPYNLGKDSDWDNGYLIRISARGFASRGEGLYAQLGFTFHKRTNETKKYLFFNFIEYKVGYQLVLSDQLIVSASVGIGFGVGLYGEKDKHYSLSDFQDRVAYIPFNAEIYYVF